MKKLSVSCLALLMFLSLFAVPAEAMMSWIEMINPRIEQLDADSYRLRVLVDWGGENKLWGESDEYGPPPDVQVPPIFNLLELTTVGLNQYNPTLNFRPWEKQYSAPGYWYSQSLYNNFGMYGALPFESTVFGYDFDYGGPIGEDFVFDFNARVEWSYRWDMGHRFFAEEWHEGSFSAQVIPEPPTIILLALSLAGLIVFRATKP